MGQPSNWEVLRVNEYGWRCRCRVIDSVNRTKKSGTGRVECRGAGLDRESVGSVGFFEGEKRQLNCFMITTSSRAGGREPPRQRCF